MVYDPNFTVHAAAGHFGQHQKHSALTGPRSLLHQPCLGPVTRPALPFPFRQVAGQNSFKQDYAIQASDRILIHGSLGCRSGVLTHGSKDVFEVPGRDLQVLREHRADRQPWWSELPHTANMPPSVISLGILFYFYCNITIRNQ